MPTKKTVIYIYHGNIITNDDLTFNQISNIEETKRNKMNILFSNSSINNSSEFIFDKNLFADEWMQDYAKMRILLAINDHPMITVIDVHK